MCWLCWTAGTIDKIQPNATSIITETQILYDVISWCTVLTLFPGGPGGPASPEGPAGPYRGRGGGRQRHYYLTWLQTHKARCLFKHFILLVFVHLSFTVAATEYQRHWLCSTPNTSHVSFTHACINDDQLLYTQYNAFTVCVGGKRLVTFFHLFTDESSHTFIDCE